MVLQVEMKGRPLSDPLRTVLLRSRLAPPALLRLAPLRSASLRSARPSPAQPCLAPPVGCPGFGFCKFVERNNKVILDRKTVVVFLYPIYMGFNIFVLPEKSLSNPKPGHTMGGSGCGGVRQGGGAERGRAGRADGSVRPGDNHPSCPPGFPGHRRQLSLTERLSGSTAT